MKTKLFVSAFLFCLLLIIAQIHAYADDTMSMDTVSPSISPTVSPIITMENKEIQYDLPYPGILPDNPLYFLKTIRDTIISFLISDPLKKADFDLQQADKQINASIYLSDEKASNDATISSTVSKALTNVTQSIDQTKTAMQQGQDTKSFLSHMDTALQKYQQVMKQLKTKASHALKENLTSDQQSLSDIQKTVHTMENK